MHPNQATKTKRLVDISDDVGQSDNVGISFQTGGKVGSKKGTTILYFTRLTLRASGRIGARVLFSLAFLVVITFLLASY